MMASIDQRADLVAFFFFTQKPLPPLLSASVFHCKSNGRNKRKRERRTQQKRQEDRVYRITRGVARDDWSRGPRRSVRPCLVPGPIQLRPSHLPLEIASTIGSPKLPALSSFHRVRSTELETSEMKVMCQPTSGRVSSYLQLGRTSQNHLLNGINYNQMDLISATSRAAAFRFVPRQRYLEQICQ